MSNQDKLRDLLEQLSNEYLYKWFYDSFNEYCFNHLLDNWDAEVIKAEIERLENLFNNGIDVFSLQWTAYRHGILEKQFSFTYETVEIRDKEFERLETELHERKDFNLGTCTNRELNYDSGKWSYWIAKIDGVKYINNSQERLEL